MASDFLRLLIFFKEESNDITEDCIDSKKLDNFIMSLTDIYIKMLKEGLVPIKETDFKFEGTYTKLFFTDGFNILRNGHLLSTLIDMLNFQLFFAMKSDNISVQEKFEIFLLSKIIPKLQPDDNSIKDYISFLVEYCSGEMQFAQIKRFIEPLGIPLNEVYYSYSDNNETPRLL